MSPLQRYHALLNAGKISQEPVQEECVVALDNLFQELKLRSHPVPRMLGRVSQKLHLTQTPVKGLYLWGGVGRGKTFLMDLFYQCLPFKQKTRMHFHRFMQYVHQSLKKYQGSVDPLAKVAREFSRRSMVLCFDEFYVSDIADAMILSELLKRLFTEGVTLVATSNLNPDDLYHNGLQRDKFLPAIDLIKAHTRVYHISGVIDYRLQYLSKAEIYHYPLDDIAEKNLTQYFHQLAGEEGVPNKVLTIAHRRLSTRFSATGIVWFTFDNLCNTPRSAEDYIEIARYFHTVLISEVKLMNAENEDAARRFVTLVDEFYDRNVTLILSAQCPVSSLYQGTLLTFEFKRTMSRLIEMQSPEYLAKPHLA